MIVTEHTKFILAIARQRRDLYAKGYEEVGENGGKLWELYRGARCNHRITDAVVAVHGKSVYVKVEAPSPKVGD